MVFELAVHISQTRLLIIIIINILIAFVGKLESIKIEKLNCEHTELSRI